MINFGCFGIDEEKVEGWFNIELTKKPEVKIIRRKMEERYGLEWCPLLHFSM
jgi:hypothetical protein